MDIGQSIQQLGIGLGLAVAVSWIFYKSLMARIAVLEKIINRHDQRESIHINFIERLISIIPSNKKTDLNKALNEYHSQLREVDGNINNRD